MKRQYTVECAICKKVVKKSNRQITCGMECRVVWNKQQRIAKAPEGECPSCGRVGKLPWTCHERKVCSTECKGRLYALHYLDPRKFRERRPPLKSSEPVLCLQCGDPFMQSKHTSKCCSTICSDRWRWANGKGERSKQRAAERRNARETWIGRCSLCGEAVSGIVAGKALGLSTQAGAAKFHRDHIVPRSRGGSDDKANLRWLCWMCNHIRMDMDLKHDHAIAEASRAFWASLRETAT